MGDGAVYQIIASRWWSTTNTHIVSGPTVGAVVIASGPEPENWKAYIGHAPGHNRKEDEQLIAAFGAKLSLNEAIALFPLPNLNVKDYKES